ncbi:hypothetical protein D3C78_561290 [compost metagenome]
MTIPPQQLDHILTVAAFDNDPEDCVRPGSPTLLSPLNHFPLAVDYFDTAIAHGIAEHIVIQVQRGVAEIVIISITRVDHLDITQHASSAEIIEGRFAVGNEIGQVLGTKIRRRRTTGKPISRLAKYRLIVGPTASGHFLKNIEQCGQCTAIGQIDTDTTMGRGIEIDEEDIDCPRTIHPS